MDSMCRQKARDERPGEKSLKKRTVIKVTSPDRNQPERMLQKFTSPKEKR